jgi:NADH:ubiquinone oxidoreductase subunit 2 (subunit N)
MGDKANHLSHFSELKEQSALLALIFAFLVFSISGIPPFGGFFIKLDLLSALLDSSHFFINYILFFFTVASFFYYLRLIKIIFFDNLKATYTANPITTNSTYFFEIPEHVGRLWLIAVSFLLLSSYIFIVQKPLLVIQVELLASYFN